MGTTYSNCQVRTDSQEAVITALTGLLKEPAYVAPAVNGWVGVYPEAKRTDPDNLAKKLSAKLSCGVFYWAIYDSDVFYYTLYENGKKRDEFDSNPDCFETVSAPKKAKLRGKPEALVPYCIPSVGYSQVLEVLQQPLLSEEEAVEATGKSLISDKSLQLISKAQNKTLEEMKAGVAQQRLEKYTFAEEQAEDLAKLLGIAEDLEACKYRDISEAGGTYINREFVSIGLEALSPKNLQKKLWELPMQLTGIKAAIDAGANVNERDPIGTPFLLRAASDCAADIVQLLLDAGVDVNTVIKQTHEHGWERGVTALMTVTGGGARNTERQIETVQILIAAGADVNAKSEAGRAALEQVQESLEFNSTTEPSKWYTEESLADGVARNTKLIEILRAAGATE
jgi:hypothetical protein